MKRSQFFRRAGQKMLQVDKAMAHAGRLLIPLLLILLLVIPVVSAQPQEPVGKEKPAFLITPTPGASSDLPQYFFEPDAGSEDEERTAERYSLRLQSACDLDSLAAQLDGLRQETENKELPVKIEDTLQLKARPDELQELRRLPCVEEVRSGWMEGRPSLEAPASPGTQHFEPEKADPAGPAGNPAQDQPMAAEFTGSISGTVTAENGGAPLEGITVQVYASDASWTYVSESDTDANGDFVIGDLADGAYRLGYFDWDIGDYISEYYDDAPDLENGSDILVVAGQDTPGVNAALAAGAHITGVITSESDGSPIAWTEASAYAYNGSYWEYKYGGNSGSDGVYDIGGMRPGTYRVSFFPWFGEYLEEYYDNVADVYGATDIVVPEAGTVTDIDAALAAEGTISGTVTAESDGSPLANYNVSAFVFNGSWWTSIGDRDTQTDGSYAFYGLWPGTYLIEFYDWENEGYLAEYYDSTPDQDSATHIIITAGADISGIDASLIEAAHITGTVTAEDGGAPIENAYAVAYLPDGGGWDYVTSSETDSSGFYDIGFLPAGTYRVKFAEGYSGDYLEEYYDNNADIDNAADVPVATGGVTPGIDAALAPAAHITGTVTDQNGGAPLQYIGVEVYRHNGSYWKYINDRSTDENGVYDVGGLPAGTYRVGFFDWNDYVYKTEYYDNAPDVNSATDIVVPDAVTVSGIDAQLSEGGHITGQITSEADGSPLYDVRACAYLDTGSYWQYINCEWSDSSGYYDIGSLPDGTYRVFFREYGDYAFEYYDNAANIDSGDDIEITLGGIVSGIDAALGAAGHITGTVTAETGGAVVRGIQVSAYFYNYVDGYWQYIIGTETDAAGNFDIGGLRPGYYRVRYYDDADIFRTEYYDDVAYIDYGESVQVTAGGVTPGIDATMSLPGAFSGTVTDATTSLGVSGIRAAFYRFQVSDWYYGGQAYTDTNGQYLYDWLLPGLYKIQFWDGSDLYAIAYFDGEHAFDPATEVTLPAGSLITGIDAVLEIAGSISGTVINDSNGLPVQDIEARAYRDIGGDWEFTYTDWTDDNGQFSIMHLPAGTYRVEYHDWYDRYMSEYFDDVADIAAASNVFVVNGADSPAVDASLAPYPPPANDDFDTAEIAAPTPYQAVADVARATTAVDDPTLPCGPGDQGSGSVWYAFTPVNNGRLTADTVGSSYDTVLAVWQGTRGALTPSACNDDTSGLQSEVADVPLYADVTYYLEVTAYGSTLGDLVLNVDFAADAPFPDCSTNTGNDASIAIPDTVNVTGGLTLEPGDEVFLSTADASLCAGHGVWTGSSLGLTAWGDDSQTPEKDGFTTGDDMVYWIWDISTGDLYKAVTVTYATTSHGLETFITDGQFVVSDLDLALREIHRLPLARGWNLISTPVDPEDPQLEAMLAHIEDNIWLMKNDSSQVFWPEQSMNSIGSWNLRDGYKINMHEAATLVIAGLPVDPTTTPISLSAGWRTIAYLGKTPVAIGRALDSVGDDLGLAKNGYGQVYWPAYGVNQIDTMQVGEGYQLYMETAGTLTYPTN